MLPLQTDASLQGVKQSSPPAAEAAGGDDAFIEAYGRRALAQAVGVDAHALSRREVVDAPPAHLQEDEGDEEPPFCLCAP